MTTIGAIKTLSLILLLGLLSGRSGANTPCREKISAEYLRRDFRITQEALEVAHGGIYRYSSKAEIDRIFRKAREKIDRPMSDLEFWQVLAPAVASLKCGHTYLAVPEAVSSQIQTHELAWPLDIEILGDRVFIMEDFSKIDQTLVGAELLSVNGVPARHLLRQIGASVTGDGDSATARAYRIPRYGIWMYGLYSFGIRSPFCLVYRDRMGQRHETAADGKLVSELRAEELRRHPEPTNNAELHFLDGGAIAVLKVRHWNPFVDASKRLSFTEFLAHSFADIRSRGTTDLIIDVRDNDGGADAPGKELFAYLWEEPFSYDRDIVCNALAFDFFRYDPESRPIALDHVELRPDGKYHLTKHPNIGTQLPREPQYAGRVFALMNGGSFSTSCEFLSTLHYHKRATFIGEEAAGGYYGCTAGQFVHVTLPHSKLILRFGLMTYYQAVNGYRHPKHSIMPDYRVTPSVQDRLAGADKEMDFALALIRSPRNRSQRSQ